MNVMIGLVPARKAFSKRSCGLDAASARAVGLDMMSVCVFEASFELFVFRQKSVIVRGDATGTENHSYTYVSRRRLASSTRGGY